MALFPLSFLALVPLFGMGANSGAKKTLANVDLTVWYVKLFLVGASALILFLVILWLFFVLKARRRKRGELKHVMAVLKKIQADVTLLKGN